ncbi:hypothetical protein HPB47_027564 [Ixodes persulcatus]|uniref:Uncharacterized protein n=1 Tax=Ixodes persulcatus TaxID=34615 RepID=A0AC60PW64_IXOPE|nr:hypothetical protein HPB47_027564 [Ixodes persulcatus]
MVTVDRIEDCESELVASDLASGQSATEEDKYEGLQRQNGVLLMEEFLQLQCLQYDQYRNNDIKCQLSPQQRNAWLLLPVWALECRSPETADSPADCSAPRGGEDFHRNSRASLTWRAYSARHTLLATVTLCSAHRALHSHGDRWRPSIGSFPNRPLRLFLLAVVPPFLRSPLLVIPHRRHAATNKDCRKKLRPPPPPLHVRERLARTTPTFQRQPHHQVPAAHPAPPPQAQANTQRRHSPSQQGSWSTIVAPPETAPSDFTPLPAQLASVQDKSSCIKILGRENAQLRKQLEPQAERTEKLERRIEELVTHLETITNAPAQSAVQATPTPHPTQQPSAFPTLQDIGRLERLIHDLGQTIERRIDAIEKRQEASETVKRKTRKTKQPAPSGPVTHLQLRPPTMNGNSPETGTDQITLRGYTTFITDPDSRTAILVQTTQTAQAHTLPTTLDYVFVELIPKKKTQASLFILNIYSPPSSPLNEIDRLFKTSQRVGPARLTDWKKFRETTPTSPIHAIEEWTAQMLEAAKKHTKELPLTLDCPAIDAHLLHLWEARRGLTKRWKKRRTNRKLRLRIAQITLETATYAIHLSQQNWSQFCTKLQGTLGTRRTWHLLGSLMGNKESRSATAYQLRRLIHNYQGTEEELLEELKKPWHDTSDKTQPPAQHS